MSAPDAALLPELRKVDFLSSLDDEALAAFAARGRRLRFAPGENVFAELEASMEVYVVLAGRAEVAIEARQGERTVLRVLERGCAFGEMSSITGQPRSATVTAVEPLEVLCFADEDFDRLRERRPAVALALVRVLADRLGAVERTIDALLASAGAPPPHAGHGAGSVHRGSIRRAWHDLVVARSRDLGFIALMAFVATLVLVEGLVSAAFHYDFAVRGVLRAAYMTGFTLLIGSAWASLSYFRPRLRRWIAAAYGVGCALIANELGVTLAFDIFYRDIHTPDPEHKFDIKALYERTVAHRAVLIGLVLLIQMAYLRPFYRRAAFVLRTRLRGLLAGRRAETGRQPGGPASG